MVLLRRRFLILHVRTIPEKQKLPSASRNVFLWWYIGGMKEKTSITLSREVLAWIDRVVGSKQSRSAFIEAVLLSYLRNRARAQIEARDLELLNKAADELAPEIEDVLRHQADVGEPQ